VLCKYIGLIQEGIFRRNGKVKQQHELMVLIKEKNEKEIQQRTDSIILMEKVLLAPNPSQSEIQQVNQKVLTSRPIFIISILLKVFN
jgi:hypothetical protein